MSDVSGHEADHASDHISGHGGHGGRNGHGVHGHVPADPNDAVVRARPPSPFALLLTAVAAALTVLALVAAAVATGQGT